MKCIAIHRLPPTVWVSLNGIDKSFLQVSIYLKTLTKIPTASLRENFVSGDFAIFKRRYFTPLKNSKRFASYDKNSIHIAHRVMNKKQYKKLIAEVAEILYDHFCQQQKSSSALSNHSGNPLIDSRIESHREENHELL